MFDRFGTSIFELSYLQTKTLPFVSFAKIFKPFPKFLSLPFKIISTDGAKGLESIAVTNIE